ncbi:MAG: ABC transporter substrate-binding protein [Burkholderiales bacterium]|nr:ABC transporter substrate-binding protein [Burkholderiales bacterium]MBK8666179.1 ABC transporter substrate-binding protein [Burkholderiales bacterium]
MKRWLCAVLLTVGVVAHAHDVTDDRGVVVRFSAPPQRVVSLLPSLTETVCAIGACARLIGVDRYSNFPPEVQKLPQVGGGLDPNIEAIVALKPDVVLMATSSRAAERLRALGVKVVALEPKTAADVRRVIGKLGQLLAVPDAERVAREIEAGVAAAAQSLPPTRRGQRVYFEASPGPHAAGPQSFIGEMLHALGLANVIGPELGPFPKINPELVVRADPDIIMAGERSGSEIARRPGWPRLRAVRGQHVCLFNAQEVDILVRPGPRMPEAARLMAHCVLKTPPEPPAASSPTGGQRQ